MPQTLLVTGGAGFIGSQFVRRWLGESRGTTVVLDKLTYAGSRDSLAESHGNPYLKFIEGDIANRPLVRQLLAEYQPRAIVNFAAESHVDRSIDEPGPFVETNIVGTWQLLEATLEYWQSLDDDKSKVFRFLQASTDEVYGDLPPPQQATLHTPYAPNSPYAAAKASADHWVRAYHRTYGLPTLTTCSTNNYGPYQFPEKLVPIVILNAIAGKKLPIYGDGMQVRDWLHVADNCQGMMCALDRGQAGETFHLASGNLLTNLELIAAVCHEVDKQLPNLPHRPTVSLCEHVEDRPGHDRRYALDTSQNERIAWTPEITLAAGLAETVTWYRKNAPWVDAMCARVAPEKRLGQRGAKGPIS